MNLRRKPVMWAVVRVFAKTKNNVAARIERALAHARKIQSLDLYEGILFVVPTDCDYGETHHELEWAISGAGLKKVHVLAARGNANSDVLNAAFHELLAKEIMLATIISGKNIEEYLTADVVTDTMKALQKGCYAVGVRTEQSRTLKQLGASELDNSFCTWDVEEVLAAGGFTSPATEEVSLALTMLKKVGTEIPIIGMVDGPEDARPQLFEGDGALEHHTNVVESKLANQQTAAESVGMPLAFLIEHTHYLSFAHA